MNQLFLTVSNEIAFCMTESSLNSDSSKMFSHDAFPHIILTDAVARLWAGISHFAQVLFPLFCSFSNVSGIPGPLGG